MLTTKKNFNKSSKNWKSAWKYVKKITKYYALKTIKYDIKRCINNIILFIFHSKYTYYTLFFLIILYILYNMTYNVYKNKKNDLQYKKCRKIIKSRLKQKY